MTAPASEYSIGTLVRHVTRPEWGPGKVLDISASTVTVYFRDYPEPKPGDAVKKISREFLRVAEIQSDPWLENIPPLKSGSMGLAKARLTLEQAVAFFQHKFPLGFSDPAYIGDLHNGERAYKSHHHDLYDQLFGKGAGEDLLRRGEIGELIRRAYRLCSINLLHMQEQIKLREALPNERAATAFFRSLFTLVQARGVDRVRFEEYVESVRDLQVSRKRRVATWPVATILPYLADPTRFMFLKPKPTLQAAERLAFDLRYDPAPNWITYERLLVMSGLLMQRLQPLGASDWMDVQSFIWVVSEH
jgi:uncharacterized protein DUF3553